MGGVLSGEEEKNEELEVANSSEDTSGHWQQRLTSDAKQPLGFRIKERRVTEVLSNEAISVQPMSPFVVIGSVVTEVNGESARGDGDEAVINQIKATQRTAAEIVITFDALEKEFGNAEWQHCQEKTKLSDLESQARKTAKAIQEIEEMTKVTEATAAGVATFDKCSGLKDYNPGELRKFKELSKYFAPNPRKIKRITDSHAAARSLVPGDLEEFREKLLVRVIMLEAQWPMRSAWILQIIDSDHQTEQALERGGRKNMALKEFYYKYVEARVFNIQLKNCPAEL
jgi:hypothetical protein